MPLMQQSSVRMARAEDEVGSVTLTASVTPPEQAVNLKWTKSGEGFDISSNGASCTVTGNDSFEGYDTSGTVKAELGSTETIVGSSDTCAITVVKDKGNLIDMTDFSQQQQHNITLRREVGNKFVVSGTNDASEWISFPSSNVITLEDGVYSFAKSTIDIKYAGVVENPVYCQVVAQGYSSAESGPSFTTYNNNSAMPGLSYKQQIGIRPDSSSGASEVSGTIIPFLTKLPDSGQLLGTADLTTSTSGWVLGGAGSGNTFTFADGNATFVLKAVDPITGQVFTTNFNHLSGDVYAVFFDAKLDTAGKVKVGETNGASVTFDLTTTMRRYAGFYTASSSQALAIIPQQTGTLTISNVKLVKVTVPAEMDSPTTLDEPRLDTGLDLDPGLSLL